MNDRLVTIASQLYSHEALAAQARLYEEGIRSSLSNESMAANFWHFSNAIGGVRIEVFEKDVERSLAVLSGVEALDVASYEAAEAAIGDEDREHLTATQEDFDPFEPTRGQLARLALLAAILGWVLFPFHFYASCTLNAFINTDGPLESDDRTTAALALVLNFVFYAAAAYYLGTLLFG